MNYNYIKQLQKRIYKMRGKIAEVSTVATNTTQQLSDMPRSGNSQNKIEIQAEKKIELEKHLNELEDELAKAIDSIPDTETGQMIRLKVKQRYSWRMIATIMFSDPSKSDATRKRCKRYYW